MSMPTMLDAVVPAVTVFLRYTTVLFVRHHPIGYLYLHRIYSSVAIYLSIISYQLISNKTDVRSKKRSLLLILALGLVDTRRRLASTATVLTNLLCFVAVLDFLYRGHVFHQAQKFEFSRVGYVDDTSARLVIRAHIEDPVEMTVAPLLDSTAAIRQIQRLGKDSDFTAAFTFKDLRPHTAYTYSTNASHLGTFSTAESHPVKWSLISSSCIKPFYPYNPLNHGLRIRGLELLSDYIAQHAVDMMLFMGDFIYIDLPVPLGWSQHDYNTAYRQVYASHSWTPALRSLPWIHVYDDHEIINDWSSNETELYTPAMDAFWNYHGPANPTSSPGKTYYTFRRGDVSFFVLDTRRYRSANNDEDGPSKTMLGPQQLLELENWLAKESSWKVVVSSVPFTQNWRGPDANDSWSGYLWERERILGRMKQTEGVVVLSGDRHEHATTLFPASSSSDSPIIEFSTSPLNQFFEPFARRHQQIEDTDISIYNHPRGNSKFGHVTFDTSDPTKLLLNYKLIVDGSEVWTYDWTMTRTRRIAGTERGGSSAADRWLGLRKLWSRVGQ